MIKGILIYEKGDYLKNKWFAQEIIDKGKNYELDIELVIVQDLCLKIEDSKLRIYAKEKLCEDISFAINRSRLSTISYQLEFANIKVFNNGSVTEICNSKVRTHQVVNGNGVKSVDMIIGDKRFSDVDKFSINYPCILKEIDGHGGDEVFKIDSIENLKKQIEEIRNNEYLIQEMCTKPGIDVRVFILGNKILGAVKRYSQTSFKSNISLGGDSERYSLNKEEQRVLNKILGLFKFDLVGIDFIFNEKNEILFNEIEDVVGVRSLYKNYEIDVADIYVRYILENLIRNKV